MSPRRVVPDNPVLDMLPADGELPEGIGPYFDAVPQLPEFDIDVRFFLVWLPVPALSDFTWLYPFLPYLHVIPFQHGPL